MRYIENTRTGEVHEETCRRVKVIASTGQWDPALALMLPGRYACWVCLPTGLPTVPTEQIGQVDLLEDFDGAPYPEEVQRLARMVSFATDELTEEFQGLLVAALESVAWYAWLAGADSGSSGVYATRDNPHPIPEGERQS